MELFQSRGVHVVDILFAGMARRARLFTEGWGDERSLEDVEVRTSFLPEPARIAPVWAETSPGRRRCPALQGARRASGSSTSRAKHSAPVVDRPYSFSR